VRLREHNRWLTETIMDEAHNTNHALLSRAVIQRLQDIEEGTQHLAAAQSVLLPANETKPQVNGVPLQRPVSPLIDHAAANHPNLQEPNHRKRYLFRQKRVLMVTSGLTRGGTERQIWATADGLLQRGYEIEVLYVTDPAGEPDFNEEFSQLGIKCYSPAEFGDAFAGGERAEGIHDLRQFAQIVDHLDVVPLGRALARAIREFRPEIVHCWSDLAN